MTVAAPAAERGIAAAYVVAAVAVVIWAGSPAATRYAVLEIDPVVVGILRTVLAAAVAVPLVLVARLPLPRERRQWQTLAVSSLGGFVLFPLVYSEGVARTSTSHAALILAVLPLITGLIGATLERRMPSRVWFLGVAVALVGEGLLIGVKDESGEATLAGDLILVAACVLAGAGYVFGSRLAAMIGTWAATFWALIVAGAVLAPMLFFVGESLTWTTWSPVAWGGLGYLVLLVGFAGYAGWYWALDKGGVVRMAPVQFAQPLVSLVFAVILFSEAITPTIIMASAAILGGIALARRG